MAQAQLQALDQERLARIEAPFFGEISNLFAQIRAELVRAQQTAPDVPQLDHRIDQQEHLFNTQLNALLARLNLVQENINERLNGIEGGDERLRRVIDNGVSTLEDLSRRKANSMFYQARIKDLPPADPSPFGAIRYSYNDKQERIFVGAPAAAAPFASGPAPTSQTISPYGQPAPSASQHISSYGNGPALGLPGSAPPQPYGGGPAPGLPGSAPPQPYANPAQTSYPPQQYGQPQGYPAAPGGYPQPGYGAPQPGYGAPQPQPQPGYGGYPPNPYY